MGDHLDDLDHPRFIDKIEKHERKYMTTTAKKEKENRSFVTPLFRVAFPKLFKPEAFGDGDPSYSVVMLFDKNTDISAVENALKKAAQRQWGSEAAKVYASIKKDPRRWPIHDGDDKSDIAGYEGSMYINAKNKKNRPGVYNARVQPVLDESEVYAGCYAVAEVLPYAYDNKFGKGFGFTLLQIQKKKEGERFTRQTDPNSIFEAEDDGSDDSGNYASGDDELDF